MAQAKPATGMSGGGRGGMNKKEKEELDGLERKTLVITLINI